MTRLPRRILMTADAVGGVWTYALELGRELGRFDIETVLVVMGARPSAAQVQDAAAIGSVSLIASDLKLEWMDEPEDDLEIAGELLLELEAERRPDVVHLNGFCHAALPFEAPVVTVAHSCVATWWRACRGAGPPPDWGRYLARVSAGVEAADLLVAPSAAFLNAFVGEHGRPRAARVIRNGLDPAGFAPLPKQPFVLAAGRLWDEAKNVALLCEAARGLAWPVQLAGPSPTRDGERLELPDNVVARGELARPELKRRMAEAAVFASPARYEPFGLAVLEAALSGCALALSDIPTFRELWDGAALFAPPGDAAALRKVLEGALADPAETSRLGAEARRRAASYSARRMAIAYVNVYRRLGSARRARPRLAPSWRATA